ncbi:MAG: hypothetical protein GWM90_01685, partial [Gemmatimonadetes bacterium]|nr:hypothetical protein [Gemmatimonadota bacterium]NIQ52316.1 hypothetical protein [Gemmatimonadota bacterium]NIU72419.1 hypothetical protein [Gammaproteobacteria bacterium]NIX42884.1 hypothetical protein [Gemmatimonadota bacterium]NIY07064.1 hypothetical protein [Gemmatimonadota bacterium]
METDPTRQTDRTVVPPRLGHGSPPAVGGTAGATGAAGAGLTRRAALARLGALACVALAGCTPLRILTGWYPEQFDEDHGLVDRVLRAFVDTVIPGTPMDDPDLARAFLDPELPFAGYASFFAADLCRRAESRWGGQFDSLRRSHRVAVVRDGLGADAATRRLYDGAIFLAQMSC